MPLTRWHRPCLVQAFAAVCTMACAMGMPNSVALAQPVSGVPQAGFVLNGEKALNVLTRDGRAHRLGSVVFESLPSGRTRFAVKMDHSILQDFFLSMREFKCLPAEAEVTCVVPYPYAHPGTIAPGELVCLEHNLLFLFKQPRDFGAKLWNGMIFRLTPTAKGFVGSPQGVDLNDISAPPDDLSKPPYDQFDRTDFAPGERWVSELRIE